MTAPDPTAEQVRPSIDSSFTALSACWRAVEGRRRRALLIIVALALAGMAEGLALISLIPMLEVAFGLAGGGSGSRWQAYLPTALGANGLFALTLAVFLGLAGAATALRYAGEAAVLTLRVEVEETLRVRLTDALLRMRWSEFLAIRSGDVTQAVIAEGFHTGAAVHSGTLAVANLIVAVFLFGLAAAISWPMTLAAAAFGAVLAGISRALGLRVGRGTRLLARESAALGDWVSQVIGSAKIFRSTGAAEAMGDRLAKRYARFRRIYALTNLFTAQSRLVYEVGGLAFIACFLCVAFVLGYAISQTVVFLAIFYRLAPRLQTIYDGLLQMRGSLGWFYAWERRQRRAEAAIDHREGRRPPTLTRSVKLEHVSYRFPGMSVPVLDNIDLEVPRGGCVALLGPSGGGKTTVTDVVTGLIEPGSGRILLDDTPLSEIDLAAYQAKIGIVLQDSPVFNTTVLHNIALFDHNPDRERAQFAAERAHAWDFIRALPKGLDTVVGERGGRLSGGQRQRLALARALYREPWLLILDEATSNLDPSSERAIVEAIADLKGKCTTLMVAHRIQPVMVADRVVVLEKGRIIEQGGREELLARSSSRFAAICAESAQSIDKGLAS